MHKARPLVRSAWNFAAHAEAPHQLLSMRLSNCSSTAETWPCTNADDVSPGASAADPLPQPKLHIGHAKREKSMKQVAGSIGGFASCVGVRQ